MPLSRLDCPLSLKTPNMGNTEYKVGKGKRDQESAQLLLERLMDHMQGFSPSVEWPDIDIFVSIPDSGLAAMWQPGLESKVDA